MKTLQASGDPWLAGEGYPGHVRAGLHYGSVAIGRIGRAGGERLDIIGQTVNIAARSIRRECSLALTAAVFRKLSPSARRLFKRHLPPASYIALEDPHPRTIAASSI